MSDKPKSRKDYQAAYSSLPTLERERRYAKAFDEISASTPTYTYTPVTQTIPVQFLPGMDITNFVLHSISPVQIPPTLADDVQAFTRSVKDVVAAVNDKVITAEEGDAVIGYLAEQFAARRANAALSRIGVSFQPPTFQL